MLQVAAVHSSGLGEAGRCSGAPVSQQRRGWSGVSCVRLGCSSEGRTTRSGRSWMKRCSQDAAAAVIKKGSRDRPARRGLFPNGSRSACGSAGSWATALPTAAWMARHALRQAAPGFSVSKLQRPPLGVCAAIQASSPGVGAAVVDKVLHTRGGWLAFRTRLALWQSSSRESGRSARSAHGPLVWQNCCRRLSFKARSAISATCRRCRQSPSSDRSRCQNGTAKESGQLEITHRQALLNKGSRKLRIATRVWKQAREPCGSDRQASAVVFDHQARAAARAAAAEGLEHTRGVS